MGTLPSGLPEYVGDDEDLARFLTQSNHFSASRVKPSAFLPNPKYTNTSIFRMRADPARLSDTWNQNNPGGRPLRGAAICQARHVRTAGLDVIASEPPPTHANIEGCPGSRTTLSFKRHSNWNVPIRLRRSRPSSRSTCS